MDINVITYIKNNPIVYNYLRENSYWYKELYRNPASLKRLEDEARRFYKETSEDKLKRLSEKIELFKTFMNVLH